MPAKLEEITLSFIRERVRFDRHGQDTGVCMAILECVAINGETPAGAGEQPLETESRRHRPLNSVAFLGDPNVVTVKAETEPNELVYGLAYRFYGRWLNHPRYGRQFAAKTFVRAQPHGRKGTIAYLCLAPWIGRQTAIRLWDRFGGDAVRICRESPDVASAAGGSQFNLERATEAAAWLENESRLEAVTIDLIDLLAGRGFPKTTAKSCVGEWGNKAADLIRHNPYLLMRFRGCGFLRSDAMYLDLGGDPARLKRQALCAWHAIASDSNGHTWFAPSIVEKGLRERIGGAKLRVIDALRLAKRARLLAVHRDGTTKHPWLAEARKAANEADVAERAREWLAAKGQWPSLDGLDVSDHQRERLADALAGPLGIFTGGPGCGKTYVAARVIAELIRVHGDGAVAVCAPTGKAAVRISEAMAGYGIDMRARTIHSLLKVASRTEGDGWGFEHGTGNPLPFRFVVVDEASMIDTDLMAALMRACGKGTHLLLVGDTGQLPPVGHGAPLRDLIAASVPCGELTEIRRNSGQVVIACHQIRAGERFQTNPAIQPEAGHNLKLLPASGADGAMGRIVDAIRKIGRHGLGNPIWDCQVIVAVNAKSQLSRKAVNQRLQAELNPTGAKVPGNPFRAGDKIVCLKNGWYPAMDDAPPYFNAEQNEDGQVYAANGEQAEVRLVETNFTVAQLDAPPRLVLIPRGGGDGGEQEEKEGAEESAGTGCRWDLAYAISCHKCVHPDTIVETDAGLMRIRELSGAERIGTPVGPRMHRGRVFYPERDCLRINSRDGNSITVTTDHKCEVWNGSDYVLKPASELSVGDFVRVALFPTVTPKHVPILPPKPLVDSRTQKDCCVPAHLSEELAEFLGLVVADGVVFRGGVRLGKRHPEVAKRFTRHCWKHFGIRCREFEDLGMLVSECQSAVVRDWLYAVGGCYPKAKSTPKCILGASSRIQAAFLRGLFEDGSVNVRGGKLDHIEWSSCFPSLRDEVKVMLNRLGIIHGKNSQKLNGHSLYIYGAETAKFLDRIGFISELKRRRLLLPHCEGTRYVVPFSRQWIEKCGGYLSHKSSWNNGRQRGYLSRKLIQEMADRGCQEAEAMLAWHHTRIRSIEKVKGPAMCVEVPGVHRFMQNGFPWGNSQGSEWPFVFVVLDEYPGARMVCSREWLYTAISRAKTACLLVGKLSTAHGMIPRQAIQRRKTFLKERIRG